ncbi:MAG: TIM barrel protein, partial [Bacteroidota bacterium]
LRVAGGLGIAYYRSNWFTYLDGKSMPDSLAFWQAEIQKLGAFNQEQGLVGCYQNHAGTKIGASFWEIYQLLQATDPRFFGAQYDIRHAMVEGGLSWRNGFKLLVPHIKTLVLKDFVWGRFGGKWKVVNVLIGEGMVDFDAYFKLLKAHQIQVPVSLHLEYPLGGAEKGRSEISVAPEVVYQAMSRDLKTVQRLWQAA